MRYIRDLIDAIIWPDYPGRLACGCDLDERGDAILCPVHTEEMETVR